MEPFEERKLVRRDLKYHYFTYNFITSKTLVHIDGTNRKQLSISAINYIPIEHPCLG